MTSFFDTVVNSVNDDEIAGTLHRDARPARYAPWPREVPESVQTACSHQGISQPWTHQAEAMHHIFRGTHTVVATGTGSGKSLSAWVPMLSWLDTHTCGSSLSSITFRPTALYLSPTKALAADQYSHVQELARLINTSFNVALCDGDSDSPMRTFAREHADIILSNPDFLHHALLPSHERWSRVLRGLRLIIIDEFHNYRGIFGAHVAHTVRRLLRLSAYYGAHPTVVFLSATTAHPEASAQLFLGERYDVKAVTEDGSPQGAQHIVLWRGKSIERGGGLVRRPSTVEAADLTTRLVAHGARVLTFMRSRPGTERVAELTREYLEAEGSPFAQHVAAYRGGFLPEERRELEHQLRTGDLRAVATTSALELGIDISGLDAVIVTGWPRTHASFFQQIGRAGRAGEEGLAIFIGREDPMDQYLLEHADTLLTSSPEAIVFDPTNPSVLTGQLCAASWELALSADDCTLFGLKDTSFFDELTRQGLLRRRPHGWVWARPGVPPQSVVNLRGDDSTVSIIDVHSGSLLGTVDSSRADTTVYPGAIYLHQGKPFEVESLCDDVALVHEHREDSLRTFAQEESHVVILDEEQSIPTGVGVWARGRVAVTSRVTSYDIRRADDGVFLATRPLLLPERVLHTGAVWFTITPEWVRSAGLMNEDLPGALHGAEHAAIGLLPLFAQCDRWDLGGLSTQLHGDTGCATVIIHDAVEGGSGFSARGFSCGSTWIRATLECIESCPCSSGCPRCIQSPKCGNNNSPLSKIGAIKVLQLLLAAMPDTL